MTLKVAEALVEATMMMMMSSIVPVHRLHGSVRTSLFRRGASRGPGRFFFLFWQSPPRARFTWRHKSFIGSAHIIRGDSSWWSTSGAGGKMGWGVVRRGGEEKWEGRVGDWVPRSGGRGGEYEWEGPIKSETWISETLQFVGRVGLTLSKGKKK